MGKISASVSENEVVVRIPRGLLATSEVVTSFEAVRPGSSVTWRQQDFRFNKRQARIVEALLDARNEGVPWLTSEHLHRIGAIEQGHFVRALFSGHPAWGTLVLSAEDIGGGPGSYRLAVD